MLLYDCFFDFRWFDRAVATTTNVVVIIVY